MLPPFPHPTQHKYMHKGPDTVRMATKDLYQNLTNAGYNMQDDVLKFQSFRYLSAGEALCRIFGYNLSHSTVGCTRLSVHLEGMDWVGDNAVQADGAAASSTLLQYFGRPACLSHLLYVDYFSQYSISKANAAQKEAAAAAGEELVVPSRGNAYQVDGLGNKVSVRNRGCLHVARIYPVSVTQGEQYYLRMLLTAVAGTSFVELRTVGARVFATYREAAEARGLLTVEREFAEGMVQICCGLATGLSTIADLRHSFVMMAVAGGDGVPVLALYRQFSYMMALDIDVSGGISPPGYDKGPIYVRLPVVNYTEGEVFSLEDYPVHEYHLLRMLGTLLDKNYSRSLEDLGLPTLAGHAAMRRGGAAVPSIQLTLEACLYVVPGRAAEPALTEQLHMLRAVYVTTYPELLTGEYLGALLEAENLGLDYDAAFFRDIDVDSEGDTFEAMYRTLNSEQWAFVDLACKSLQHQVERKEALKQGKPLEHIPDHERYLHLQARGGRGKSYVTRCIIAKALHLRLISCVSSFAGIAAILLPLGQTCHRTYGLPLDTSTFIPSTLTTRSAQGQRLAACSLHIVDEVESLHKHLFTAASEVTTRCVNDRYGCDDNLPFGGAMVILLGDKHQSLPITPGSVNDDVTIDSMVRASPLFAKFNTTEFTAPHRSKNDPAYDDWLTALSTNAAPGPVVLEEGQLPPTLRKVFIPDQCFRTSSLDAALVWLFGPKPPPQGPFPPLNPRHALLTCLNATVDEVNDIVLDTYVGGEVITLDAAHEVCKDTAGNEDAVSRTHASVEYLRGVKQSGVPPATLRLKTGCAMLLTRNMLSTLGLVNGTRLILLSEPPANILRGY